MAADYLISRLEIIAWSVGRLTLWLAVFAAIFVPIERLFALHPQKALRRGIAADVGFYFINALVPGLILGPPISLAVLAIHRIMPGAALLAIAAWPIWLKACATMLVGETAYYWAHRASHQIPLLWRFHAVHHSAEELDFLVNNRMHPVDIVWTRMIQLTPIFALGLANPLQLRRRVHRDVRPPDRVDLVLFHPFQHPLAVRAVRVASDHAGLPPLAPHVWRQAARLQLRLDVSVAGPHFRHPLPAERVAGTVRHRGADAAYARRPIH